MKYTTKVPTKYRNKLTRGIIHILNNEQYEYIWKCVDKVNDKFDSFLYDLKDELIGPVEFKTSHNGTFELRRSGTYANRIRDYSKNKFLVCVSFKTRYFYMVPTKIIEGKCSISEVCLKKNKCANFKLSFSKFKELIYVGCYPIEWAVKTYKNHRYLEKI